MFLTEKIPLLYHKQIGLYGLDFYNEAKKKYIEIDGESHYVDKKTIEIDKRRTVFLSENGWSGKRIRWSTYKRASKNDKNKLYKKLDHF